MFFSMLLIYFSRARTSVIILLMMFLQNACAITVIAPTASFDKFINPSYPPVARIVFAAYDDNDAR